MTTASTSHFASPIVPIRWLNFDRPADLRTFPHDALPRIMQCAVRDRQREMIQIMQNGKASLAEASGRGERSAEKVVFATGETPTAQGQRVMILVADPWDCLVSAIAAHGLRCDVFLCDPNWSEAERAAVFAQVQPAIIVRDRPLDCPQTHDPVSQNRRILLSQGVTLEGSIADPSSDLVPKTTPHRTPLQTSLDRDHDRDPYWAIPTGGTSGRIRFACHTWQTLTASAIGVRDFFRRDRLNSFCCLPVFHVSGLAQAIRAIISGGQLALAPPSVLRREQNPNHITPDRDLRHFWLSLVPTQLQRLIDCPAWLIWLQQFEVIFLGGAPAWEELLTTARSQGLRLAPTFGMTETASQIATLHPDDFLAGRTGCGHVLPHAHLSLAPLPVPEPKHHRSQSPSSPTPGLISIRARSLFLGYYDAKLGAANPETATLPWRSDDLGYFDADGSLQIVGRASQKVITGGENVYPEEVEAAIRETGLVRDVAVMGLPDREWGQRLAAAYVAWDTPVAADYRTDDRRTDDRRQDRDDPADRLVEQLRDRLAAKLARYKIPKHWLAIDQLPRNDRGKIDRTTLAQRFTPELPEPD